MAKNNFVKEKEAHYYGWVIVFLGFMLMAIVFVGSFSVNSLFVKPVCDAFGIERGTMSLYLTISSIATMLASPLVGTLMGKHSPKLIAIISIALLGTSILLLSYATGITAFYVIAIFRGIGFAGGVMLTINVLINNWFGIQKKGTAMGIALIGSSVGGFIMVPLISAVIQSMGWRWGYRILAIMMIVIIIPLMALLAVDSPEKKGLTRIGDPEGEIPALNGPDIKTSSHTPAFWMLILSILLVTIACTGQAVHAIPYFTDIGISPAEAAEIQSVGLLLLAVGKLVVGRLNDKAGTKRAVLFSGIVLTLNCIVMDLIATSHAMIPVYIIVYALGQPLATMAPVILVARIFGNRSFASINGYLALSSGLAQAIGSYMAGYIYDTTGSYHLSWIISAVMCAAGIVLMLMALRKDYTKSDEQKV